MEQGEQHCFGVEQHCAWGDSSTALGVLTTWGGAIGDLILPTTTQVLFIESICDDPAIIEENIKVRTWQTGCRVTSRAASFIT